MPHRAELAVGVIVGAVVLVADVRGAIGFSSFAMLAYYAIANGAAWTLAANERRWPRALAVVGLVSCVVVAVTLPLASVVGGALVLVAGVLVHACGVGRDVRALVRRSTLARRLHATDHARARVVARHEAEPVG